MSLRSLPLTLTLLLASAISAETIEKRTFIVVLDCSPSMLPAGNTNHEDRYNTSWDQFQKQFERHVKDKGAEQMSLILLPFSTVEKEDILTPSDFSTPAKLAETFRERKSRYMPPNLGQSTNIIAALKRLEALLDSHGGPGERLQIFLFTDGEQNEWPLDTPPKVTGKELEALVRKMFVEAIARIDTRLKDQKFRIDNNPTRMLVRYWGDVSVPPSENVIVIPPDEHCSLALRLAESNFKTAWSPNGFSIDGDIFADVDGITEFEATARITTRHGSDKLPPLTFVKDTRPGVLHAKLSRVLAPSFFGAEAGDKTVTLSVESTRVWRNESKTLLATSAADSRSISLTVTERPRVKFDDPIDGLYKESLRDMVVGQTEHVPLRISWNTSGAMVKLDQPREWKFQIAPNKPPELSVKLLQPNGTELVSPFNFSKFPGKSAEFTLVLESSKPLDTRVDLVRFECDIPNSAQILSGNVHIAAPWFEAVNYQLVPTRQWFPLPDAKSAQPVRMRIPWIYFYTPAKLGGEVLLTLAKNPSAEALSPKFFLGDKPVPADGRCKIERAQTLYCELSAPPAEAENRFALFKPDDLKLVITPANPEQLKCRTGDKYTASFLASFVSEPNIQSFEIRSESGELLLSSTDKRPAEPVRIKKGDTRRLKVIAECNPFAVGKKLEIENAGALSPAALSGTKPILLDARRSIFELEIRGAETGRTPGNGVSLIATFGERERPTGDLAPDTALKKILIPLPPIEVFVPQIDVTPTIVAASAGQLAPSENFTPVCDFLVAPRPGSDGLSVTLEVPVINGAAVLVTGPDPANPVFAYDFRLDAKDRKTTPYHFTVNKAQTFHLAIALTQRYALAHANENFYPTLRVADAEYTSSAGVSIKPLAIQLTPLDVAALSFSEGETPVTFEAKPPLKTELIGAPLADIEFKCDDGTPDGQLEVRKDNSAQPSPDQLSFSLIYKGKRETLGSAISKKFTLKAFIKDGAEQRLVASGTFDAEIAPDFTYELLLTAVALLAGAGVLLYIFVLKKK